MNPPRIRTQPDLDTAFGAGPFLLLKHSLLCPVSARAFREYMHFLAEEGLERPATGWLSVTDERPLSDAVAARTGIRHESPQAFVLRGGVPLWQASHGSITRDALRQAWSAVAAT